jgi:hypothetical protein
LDSGVNGSNDLAKTIPVWLYGLQEGLPRTEIRFPPTGSLINGRLQLTRDERINSHHHIGGQIALHRKRIGSWKLLCIAKARQETQHDCQQAMLSSEYNHGSPLRDALSERIPPAVLASIGVRSASCGGSVSPSPGRSVEKPLFQIVFPNGSEKFDQFD